ncbi:MAG: hypothetical protein HYS86_02390 [Candidatus Chisholmbacteria bacterium]|nr:hypothetical protein [Candidatus Chisholmbacteria bacterium]
MSKTIVTHLNPDLDALTAVWLLKRFGGEEFVEARLAFIPAGETYRGVAVDSDPEVVHVDVGLGKFDHHQVDMRTSAAELVYQSLGKEKPELTEDEALKRLVAIVVDIDYGAGDLSYPEAASDRYAMLFNERQIIGGWYRVFPGQSDKIAELGLTVLDGVYESLRGKVVAEGEFERAKEFETQWGKGIGMETAEREFGTLAFARGYTVVVTKDPEGGNVRVKAREKQGGKRIDLTPLYNSVREKDPEADWYFHVSRKMLLNGSRVNPKMKASRLTLAQVIALLQHA